MRELCFCMGFCEDWELCCTSGFSYWVSFGLLRTVNSKQSPVQLPLPALQCLSVHKPSAAKPLRGHWGLLALAGSDCREQSPCTQGLSRFRQPGLSRVPLSRVCLGSPGQYWSGWVMCEYFSQSSPAPLKRHQTKLKMGVQSFVSELGAA